MGRGTLIIAVLGWSVLGAGGPWLVSAAWGDPDRTQRGLVRPGSGSSGNDRGGGGERSRESSPPQADPAPPAPSQPASPAARERPPAGSPAPDTTRRGMIRGAGPDRPRQPSAIQPPAQDRLPSSLRNDRDRTRRSLVREPIYVRPRWHDGYWRDRQHWNQWYDQRWDDDCAYAQYARTDPWRTGWTLSSHTSLPLGGPWTYRQDYAWRYSTSPWTGLPAGFDWGGGWYRSGGSALFTWRSNWSCGGLDDWWYSPWRSSRVVIFSEVLDAPDLDEARFLQSDPSVGRWEYEPSQRRWRLVVAPDAAPPPPAPMPAPVAPPDPAQTDRERAATAISRRMALNSRYDVAADIRSALSATSDSRYSGAITALRRAASQHPDALVSPTGSGALMLLGSRDWTQRARYALEVFRQPPRASVDETDSLFAQSVLLALLGDRDTALATIRTGISKGDARPSTIALAEALSDHALVLSASK